MNAGAKFEARPAKTNPRVGLRHLMLASVIFAFVFSFIARAINTGAIADIMTAVAVVGASFIALGLYMTSVLTRGVAVGWIIVIVGTIAVGWATLGPYSLIFDGVLIVGVVFLVDRARQVNQDALAGVMAIAARRGIPLAPGIRALADQTRGIHRRRALILAEALEFGLPLPEAIEASPGCVSKVSALLIRVGWDSGSLPEALELAASSRTKRPPGWQRIGSKLSYLCAIVYVSQGLISFLLVFITPRLQAIFKDFGLLLPWPTRMLMDFSSGVGAFGALPQLLLYVVELTFIISLPSLFAGYENLSIPLLDRFFARRHAVVILRCLALVVGKDRPITPALYSLARWYPAGWVSDRLSGVVQAVSGGMSWIDGLRSYRLITPSDTALLRAANRVGNLPWALRELSAGIERRIGYRLQALSRLFFTLALLAIGAAVFCFCVATFMPLVILITELAS